MPLDTYCHLHYLPASYIHNPYLIVKSLSFSSISTKATSANVQQREKILTIFLN